MTNQELLHLAYHCDKKSEGNLLEIASFPEGTKEKDLSGRSSIEFTLPDGSVKTATFRPYQEPNGQSKTEILLNKK